MSISPESHIGSIPRFAMAGAALLSFAYKPDLAQTEHAAAEPEITTKADPRLVSHAAKLSNKLVRDYLANYSIKKLEVLPKLSPAELAASEVTPLEFKMWSRVDVCEESGNWHGGGPEFSGLGISAANWVKYGGEQFAPTGYQATPDEQIVIAERIQPNPPDQGSVCEPW